MRGAYALCAESAHVLCAGRIFSVCRAHVDCDCYVLTAHADCEHSLYRAHANCIALCAGCGHMQVRMQ